MRCVQLRCVQAHTIATRPVAAVTDKREQKKNLVILQKLKHMSLVKNGSLFSENARLAAQEEPDLHLIIYRERFNIHARNR